MEQRMVNENSELALASLSLTPGRDKAGQPERAHIHFKPGEITALLGPTGAGKSRFLADIESLAAGDTFRAAAVEQLKVWGERVGCPVIAKEIGRAHV